MLYYSQADKPLKVITHGTDYIHHPRFGHLLKEKMDRLGVRCVLKLRKDYLYRFSNLNQDRVDFFVDVFNK
jgi:hypothetical protein